MKCFKKSICLICLILILVSTGPAGFAEEKTLYFSLPRGIGHMNPHMYGTPFVVQNMIYEPLIRYGHDGKLAPHLALRWTISPDGREYTFFLRKGVKFSDGLDFNALAVKMNFDAVLMNREKYAWLELVNRIEEVRVLDEHVVKLVLSSYYYPALWELALFRPLVFLSPASFPENGNTGGGIKKPVGSGPWKFSEESKGDYAVFERNPLYWGKKPAIDKIRIQSIPDPESRALAIEAGEIDLIHGGGYAGGAISMDTFKYFRDSGKFKTAISPPRATRMIVINSARVDLPVRRALQHAVNKDAISSGVFHGIEKPADALFARDFPYSDVDLAPYDYNPEKAKVLLSKAGWMEVFGGIREKDGRPLNIEINFQAMNPIHKFLAEVLQGDLARVGIHAKLVGEEPQACANRWKTGRFDLALTETWGAPYDPHSMINSMLAPSHADYQAQIGLPMKGEIDTAIVGIMGAREERTRRNLYAFVLKTLHEQAVYLPLTHLASIAVWRPNLGGVEFGPTMYEIPFELMEVGL